MALLSTRIKLLYKLGELINHSFGTCFRKTNLLMKMTPIPRKRFYACMHVCYYALIHIWYARLDWIESDWIR